MHSWDGDVVAVIPSFQGGHSLGQLGDRSPSLLGALAYIAFAQVRLALAPVFPGLGRVLADAPGLPVRALAEGPGGHFRPRE